MKNSQRLRERKVNFDLPAYAVAFLQEQPGWRDFDPRKEVIHCDKPGMSCNDAPRCFSQKLAKVMRDICGMLPCTTDNELYFLHKEYTANEPKVGNAGGSTDRVQSCNATRTGGVGSRGADDPRSRERRLMCIMAKHVNELKLTGDRATVVWVLANKKGFWPVED